MINVNLMSRVFNEIQSRFVVSSSPSSELMEELEETSNNMVAYLIRHEYDNLPIGDIIDTRQELVERIECLALDDLVERGVSYTPKRLANLPQQLSSCECCGDQGMLNDNGDCIACACDKQLSLNI